MFHYRALIITKKLQLQWRHIMEQSTMRYKEHRVSGGI